MATSTLKVATSSQKMATSIGKSSLEHGVDFPDGSTRQKLPLLFVGERLLDTLLIRKSRNIFKILFLELGVGYNTPVIIKYPFWRMTAKNPNTFYACVNQGQAVFPPEIPRQSVCIHADIGAVIAQL